jgi:hypothetical protein
VTGGFSRWLGFMHILALISLVLETTYEHCTTNCRNVTKEFYYTLKNKAMLSSGNIDNATSVKKFLPFPMETAKEVRPHSV